MRALRRYLEAQCRWAGRLAGGCFALLVLERRSNLAEIDGDLQELKPIVELLNIIVLMIRDEDLIQICRRESGFCHHLLFS